MFLRNLSGPRWWWGLCISSHERYPERMGPPVPEEEALRAELARQEAACAALLDAWHDTDFDTEARREIEHRLDEAEDALVRLACAAERLLEAHPAAPRVFSTWLATLGAILPLLPLAECQRWVDRAIQAALRSPLPGATGDLAEFLVDTLTRQASDQGGKHLQAGLDALHLAAPGDPEVTAGWARAALAACAGPDRLAALRALLDEARRAAPDSPRVLRAWLDVTAAHTGALRARGAFAEVLAVEGALAGLDERAQALVSPLSFARILRDLGLAHYEAGETTVETIRRLDELAARAAPLCAGREDAVLANCLGLQRYAIVARTDVAWSFAADGAVRFAADAARWLREADERLTPLVGVAEGASPAARGHVAAAARVLHYVLLRPGCPLSERAGPWMELLSRWRSLGEEEAEREWAYARSDRAMRLAEAGDPREAEAAVAEIAPLYNARRSGALRRALSKAVAALGGLPAHRLATLQRLAALLIFHREEEHARFFALVARRAVTSAVAAGAWSEAAGVLALMGEVARRRPAAILLRHEAEARALLRAAAPPGAEDLAPAALPWPRLSLRRRLPRCLVDELGLEMFLPGYSLACAWSSERGQIVSVNQDGLLEGYTWRGVPSQDAAPVFQLPCLDEPPPTGVQIELLDGGRAARVHPGGGVFALPWPGPDR